MAGVGMSRFRQFSSLAGSHPAGSFNFAGRCTARPPNKSLHRTPELAALALAPVSSGRWAARRSVRSVCGKENPLEEKRW